MQEGRNFNNKGPREQEEISSRVEGLMADVCFFFPPPSNSLPSFYRRAVISYKTVRCQRRPRVTAISDCHKEWERWRFFLVEEELNIYIGLSVCWALTKRSLGGNFGSWNSLVRYSADLPQSRHSHTGLAGHSKLSERCGWSLVSACGCVMSWWPGLSGTFGTDSGTQRTLNAREALL